MKSARRLRLPFNANGIGIDVIHIGERHWSVMFWWDDFHPPSKAALEVIGSLSARRPSFATERQARAWVWNLLYGSIGEVA